MTRRLTAKVARLDFPSKSPERPMATFKRVRRRVISTAEPLGQPPGFRVSPEGPVVGVSTKLASAEKLSYTLRPCKLPDEILTCSGD